MRPVGCGRAPLGRLRCVAVPGYVPSKVRPFVRPRRRSCGGGVCAPEKLCAPSSTFVCAYVRVELAGVHFVGAASPSGYKSRCTAHVSSVGVEFVLKKRRSCAGTTASTVSFFFLWSSSSLCHSSAAERGESATVRRRARARHQQKLLSCWQYKFVTYTIFSLIHQTF